jgi:hypothetical protein
MPNLYDWEAVSPTTGERRSGGAVTRDEARRAAEQARAELGLDTVIRVTHPRGAVWTARIAGWAKGGRGSTLVWEPEALTPRKHQPAREPAPRSVPNAAQRAEHARRIMWRRLDEARALHDRIEAGHAFAWEPVRLTNLIREARTYSRAARALMPRRECLQIGACGSTYSIANNQRNTEI